MPPRSDRARRFQASPNSLQQLSGVQGTPQPAKASMSRSLGGEAKEGPRAEPPLYLLLTRRLRRSMDQLENELGTAAAGLEI